MDTLYDYYKKLGWKYDDWLSSMQPQTIQRVFQAYGIEPHKIDPPQGGYRNKVYTGHFNQTQSANVIVYKNEPEILTKIRQANRLSNHLHTKGLYVRHSLDNRIVTLASANTTQYAALYNCLSGSTIAWEAYTQDHLKVLGFAMATMHLAAADLKRKDEPYIQDVCFKQAKSMQRYFADDGVVRAMNTKLKLHVSKSVLSMLHKLAQVSQDDSQLLHMDFVRGNVLFQNTLDKDNNWVVGKVQVSGIIDFEKVAYGNPVYDIARTLAFLLVDSRYKTNIQIYKYFLDSGYIKRGKGVRPNTGEIAKLVKYFLMYDYYKFLKHSPYESLKENLHFRRTVALLLQHGLLEKA